MTSVEEHATIKRDFIIKSFCFPKTSILEDEEDEDYKYIHVLRQLKRDKRKITEFVASLSDDIIDDMYRSCIILYNSSVVLKAIELKDASNKSLVEFLNNIMINNPKWKPVEYDTLPSKSLTENEYLYFNIIAKDIYNIHKELGIEERKYDDEEVFVEGDEENTTELGWKAQDFIENVMRPFTGDRFHKDLKKSKLSTSS